jgi:cytochrome c oxidase cbb3-type subunit 2/cytochrome c oxidase cbb3-type subunit I/II
VLIAARDNPANVMLGAIGLFLIVLVVGLVGPSIPFDEPGARTSEIPFSTLAEEGQVIYQSQGCNACHTQLVRPVVADVGLGPVTLNDSNQVIGTRRFGPDLSDVGSRYSGEELTAIVTGDVGEHPPYGLAPDDMAAVVAYLSESRTSG